MFRKGKERVPNESELQEKEGEKEQQQIDQFIFYNDLLVDIKKQHLIPNMDLKTLARYSQTCKEANSLARESTTKYLMVISHDAREEYEGRKRVVKGTYSAVLKAFQSAEEKKVHLKELKNSRLLKSTKCVENVCCFKEDLFPIGGMCAIVTVAATLLAETPCLSSLLISKYASYVGWTMLLEAVCEGAFIMGAAHVIEKEVKAKKKEIKELETDLKEAPTAIRMIREEELKKNSSSSSNVNGEIKADIPVEPRTVRRMSM